MATLRCSLSIYRMLMKNSSWLLKENRMCVFRKEALRFGNIFCWKKKMGDFVQKLFVSKWKEWGTKYGYWQNQMFWRLPMPELPVKMYNNLTDFSGSFVENSLEQSKGDRWEPNHLCFLCFSFYLQPLLHGLAVHTLSWVAVRVSGGWDGQVGRPEGGRRWVRGKGGLAALQSILWWLRAFLDPFQLRLHTHSPFSETTSGLQNLPVVNP